MILKSGLAKHSVLYYFRAFNNVQTIQKEWNLKADNALLKSMHARSWYLSTKAVIMVLADSRLDLQTKFVILETLLHHKLLEIELINLEKPTFL